jgi:flagellar basal-body rod protein FlgB
MLMSRKMAWLSQRTQILAENVANADSPGFKARDLKEVEFGKLVARELSGEQTAGTPTRTNAMHLASLAGDDAAAFDAEPEREPFETTISGNTVNIEQQMAKLGETQMAYQMVVDLYRKQIAMFRTALGRGSS